MKYKSVTYYNKDGGRHREDGPAVINADGSKQWWKKGKIHRLDGPAYIVADGYKAWYQNGERHRLDGPAVIGSNGKKRWFQNDKLHRIDGPSSIWGSLGWESDWHLEDKNYGEGDEPPEKYLKELKRLGIPFVRGSDNPEDYPE